ncbi:MAG: hypothetical protein IT293_17030 [Deltaproteobacteria bacterium]|nr:hypothetical protein [Deltaproteobacteria bacterium]
MRFVRSSRIIVFATLGVLAGSPAPARAAFLAYDLNGTWAGKITCKAFVAGVQEKVVLTPTMRISQFGQSMGVELDFGLGSRLYAGLANPDAKKPERKGETALIRCGTDNQLGITTPDEIGRMSASAKPGKVKASLKGLSFYSDGGTHGTCKWSWKRIDTNDAGLPTECPGEMMETGGPR